MTSFDFFCSIRRVWFRCCFYPKPATSGNAIRKSPFSRTVNSDKQAALRASIKLDAGDVKGTLRIVASDDASVIPDALSYNTTFQTYYSTLRLSRMFRSCRMSIVSYHIPSHHCARMDAHSSTVPQFYFMLSSFYFMSFGPGFACGWDGLRSTQHLQDMASPTGLTAVLRFTRWCWVCKSCSG